jgi:PmbA protein
VNLVLTGERVLAETGRRLPGAQAEAFLLASESRNTEWSEGAPENDALSQSQGLGLRVVHEGRLGFGYTNQLTLDAVSAVVERAAAGARLCAAEPLLEIPESPKAASSPVELQLVDPSLNLASSESRASFLKEVEADVKRRDPRLAKVLRASYREGRVRTAVVNNRGVRVSGEGTHVSFALACVAVEGSETQVGYGFQAVRHHADLKTGWVVDKTVEHTLSLLGGKQLPSGRYDLLLDPFVAAEILELIASALRADQVLKGKSFLGGRVGESVGASCLDLIDDGRLLRGLGSSPYDAEGLPTQTTVLIRQGVLQGFLYDSYNARRAGKLSSGNAGRASYKSVPGPEETNFYLKPGTQSPETLVSSSRSGIYVRSVMGLHTVDVISGDFSLGVMGERIENGRRTHGVRGVTIAGNLLDLMKNVTAVGSDLIFSGSVGSPTLCIRDISVGGA